MIHFLTLALVIVAGAALAAVKFIPDEEVEAAETEVIFSLDSDAATSLSWTHEGETLRFENSGGSWVCAGDEDFPLDVSYINTMLGELEELTSSKTIEAPDDLAEYGLDEPECSISVTAEAETTIDIGGETSLDGLRYVSIGDGNVYLVSSDLLTNFSCGLYDLVSKEAIPDMSDLVSFTVETASGTLDIEYLEDSGLAYTDRYTWFSLADGEYTALDNELTEDLVSLVTGLSWGECVVYDADVKDLGDYGLDTPSVTVSVSYIETTEVETNETDEDGSTLYDYASSLDGEEADFTDVLQQLEALSSTGSAEGVSTALGEEIAFTFHRDSENFAEVELVIYGYDSASCIAVLNGGSALFVPREDVQAIVDAVEALLA